MTPKKKIDIEENKIRLRKQVTSSFFDDLEKNILNETITAKKVQFQKWIFTSIAASLVLFLGLYIVFKSPTPNLPNMAGISTEEILEQEVEFTNEEYASLVSMEQLIHLEEEITKEFTQSDISEEMVLDIYDEI